MEIRFSLTTLIGFRTAFLLVTFSHHVQPKHVRRCCMKHTESWCRNNVVLLQSASRVENYRTLLVSLPSSLRFETDGDGSTE